MDFKLPNLGEGADSGVVVSLFVKEGDTLQKDQPVLELENEKAIATIPSSVAGKVTAVFVKVGDKIAVGQKVLAVSAAGEPAQTQPSAAPPEPAPATAPSPAQRLPAAPMPPAALPEQARFAQEPEPGAQPAAAPAASPSIRRLARDLGLDLTRIRGSERGGRIVMGDLRAYIQQLQRLAFQAAAAPAPLPKPVAEPIDFSKWGPVTVKPLSPLRQVISRRLLDNYLSIPHVTQFDEADVTRLMELRKQFAPAYEQRGARLTLTAFLVKALVATLGKHPTFNASLDHTGENLVLKSYYHIGIAVDTEAGLIVPALRDADKKSLLEISRELEELARKARERKVTADELRGGTFTLSNQGGIGGAHFTPIINKPEVAILGVGRGAVKPVWREGKLEPRTLLPLALSYDHRVIDGGAAARFIVDLVQACESFDQAAVSI